MIRLTKEISKIILLALTFGALSAFAGVKEYNEAMGKGDFAAAAMETEAIWNAFDKSNAAAATLAREFAYVNFMATDYESAKMFINELVGDNESPIVDDQPDLSRVMADAITYRLDLTPENRAKLVQSLKARLKQPDTDVISIMISEFLYQNDWGYKDWSGVVETSTIAADLVNRIGPPAVYRKRRAQVQGAAAQYLMNKGDASAYDNMVELHNNLVTDIDAVEDANLRAELIKLKWNLHAWIANAEEMHTTYSAKLENPVGHFLRKPLKKSEKGYFFEDLQESNSADDLPVCQYVIDMRRLRFLPQSEEYRNQVGTVLFKMDVDAKGKISNAVPLASVPEDRYAMMAGFWPNSITMKRVKGESKKTCRLEQKNALVPISFEIERPERRLH